MLPDLLNIKNTQSVFAVGVAATALTVLMVFPLQLPGGSPQKPGPDSATQYFNPIIFADYSDPDVIRVDNDFYLVSSSFINTPGIPVLHSTDLIHWQIIGHAVENLPDTAYELPQPGRGIWAPSLRYHNGEYLIYYGDPDLGIFQVKSKNPAGPWEKPLLVKSAKGWIDPCPFWDDDGQAYLIHAWAKSRVGFNGILTLHKMSPDGTQILDEGVTVFDGNANHPTIEGPKMYKRNGWCYIFAPAGGVRNGWQTVLRSKNIYGRYEDKIVLEQGGTAVNGPHQGAWIEMADGKSWFVHFQDRDAYGRIVHLQPLVWKDDWPQIGVDLDGNGIGEPIASCRKPNVSNSKSDMIIQTSDDFTVDKLGLQWQWRANHRPEWFTLTTHPGYLRLFAINPAPVCSNLGDLPNILTQKFPAEGFALITKIDFHPESEVDQAGLIVIGADYAALKIVRQNNEYWLIRADCRSADQGSPEILREKIKINKPELFLKVIVDRDAVCNFYYSQGGQKYIPIGNKFLAVKGKWVGAQVGLFATTATGKSSAGYADFDFFHVIIAGQKAITGSHK